MRAPMSYEIIARAMFENYESIYDIVWESHHYDCYYQSESYRKLQLSKSGADFFADLQRRVPEIIAPEDQSYVLQMLSPQALSEISREGEHHSFIYRILRDGREIYHQVRAVRKSFAGQDHILMGILDIDDMVRKDLMHFDKIESMHQKEKNYLEAVLDTAAGYLEINLSQDAILDYSPAFAGRAMESLLDSLFSGTPTYQEFVQVFCEKLVKRGQQKILALLGRNNLMQSFLQGAKRVYARFSMQMPGGEEQPCSVVCFVYQDHASGELHAFGVLYDLTEQQKREIEVETLENELRMSRIRNFTSQMQPHFLYNALGSIQEIVLEEPEYASQLIGDFAVHLRSCIRAMASDTLLPFSQELENIRAYANIEKMRFGDKLSIRYEIGCQDFPILPLSIQPLVENAIRHGIYHKGKEGGQVVIRSFEEPDAWIVEVEDNGIGFDYQQYMQDLAAGAKDSAGLQNLIFRIDKVMHGHVQVHSEAGAGTHIRVRLPKGESYENNYR